MLKVPCGARNTCKQSNMCSYFSYMHMLMHHVTVPWRVRLRAVGRAAVTGVAVALIR